MKIDDNLLDHIAHLSRLSFEGSERDAIKKDLEQITDFMAQLEEVNTDNVEPLIFMSENVNVLREDVPKVSVSHEEALLNAPKKDSDYFRIPKVKN
jgi:aspartyl-tRNA(Asn)/glutamyl-tRNA(Gln) amidotransferase subunit C